MSTDNKAPLHVVFATPQLPRPSLDQTPSAYVPLYMAATQCRGSYAMQRFQFIYVSIHCNITSLSAQQPQNTAQYGFVVLLFREGFLVRPHCMSRHFPRLLTLFLTYCTFLCCACPLLIFLTIR